MRTTTRTTVLATLLGFPLSTLSATVQRCEDPQGHITFTTLGCPSDHSVQSYNAFNAPPGSTIPLLPDALPSTQAPVSNIEAKKELVVVGQRDEVCDNLLSDKERRRSIINQQARAGMTLRDVENALGKPDRIVKRNRETRYYYDEDKGRSSQVFFDEDGCVKKGKH